MMSGVGVDGGLEGWRAGLRTHLGVDRERKAPGAERPQQRSKCTGLARTARLRVQRQSSRMYLGTYLGTDMCRQQLSGVWKGEGMDRRDAGHAAIPSQANEIVGDARVGPQSWLAG